MKLDQTKSTAPEKIPASSCPRQKKLSRIKLKNILAALSVDRYYRLYTRNEDKLNKRPNSGHGFLMGSIGLHFCSIFLVLF